jgi:hypothetical protein
MILLLYQYDESEAYAVTSVPVVNSIYFPKKYICRFHDYYVSLELSCAFSSRFHSIAQVLNQLCDVIVEQLRDCVVTGLLQASLVIIQLLI